MFGWFAQAKTRRAGKRRTGGGEPTLPRRYGRSAAVVLEELENRFLLAAYFVSTSGNDANSGTAPGAAAWRTIDRVNVQDFLAGDSVSFQGGATFNGGIVFDYFDLGTAVSPVTVNSYGTGRATIRSGTTNGIFAYDVGGLNISNLNFVGSGMNSSDTDGIIFFNDLPGNVELQHVYIDNVDVSQYGWEGISIFGYNGLSGYRDVRITNSKLHHNLSSGMATYGPDILAASTTKVIKDVYVGHVEAYRNAGKPNPIEGRGGNGIVFGSVDGGVIERSLAHDNGLTNTRATGTGNAGIMVYNSNNVTVQFNELYRNRTSDYDGGGIDFDWGVTNSVMQYNYSHENDGFGYMALGGSESLYFLSNITIRYNISQNDARKNWGSILLYGINGAEVFNNTVYINNATQNPDATAMLLWGNLTGVRVRNNIFQTAGGVRLIYTVAPFISDILFQDNAYWSSGGTFRIDWSGTIYSSMAAWRTATTNQEMINTTPVGHQVNPGLTSPGGGGTIGNADLLANLNAYKLQSTSPLKDAGTNLLLTFGVNPGPRDFYGNSLTGVTAFSIGAHEL